MNCCFYFMQKTVFDVLDLDELHDLCVKSEVDVMNDLKV